MNLRFNAGTKQRLTVHTAATPGGIDYDDITDEQIGEIRDLLERGMSFDIGVQDGRDIYPAGSAVYLQQRTVVDERTQFVELWQHCGTDELYLGDPNDTERVWLFAKQHARPGRFCRDALDLLTGEWALEESEYLTETSRDAPELVLELAAVYRRTGGVATADIKDHIHFREAYAIVRARAEQAHRAVLAATGGVTDAALTYITGRVRNPDARN